jgi:hypothetical protein
MLRATEPALVRSIAGSVTCIAALAGAIAFVAGLSMGLSSPTLERRGAALMLAGWLTILLSCSLLGLTMAR